MYELILWIIIVLLSTSNIIFTIIIIKNNKTIEFQRRFLGDLVEATIEKAEDMTLDDVFFTEDDFNE